MVDKEAGKIFGKKNKKHNNRRKTDAIARAGRRRSYFLAILCIALAGILIYRLHWLQIVNGERYLSDFETSIRRTVVTREKGKDLRCQGQSSRRDCLLLQHHDE